MKVYIGAGSGGGGGGGGGGGAGSINQQSLKTPVQS